MSKRDAESLDSELKETQDGQNTTAGTTVTSRRKVYKATGENGESKTYDAANWGKLELFKMTDANDFTVVLDQLYYEKIEGDTKSFFDNRATLLEHFTKGNVYGLYVVETDYMFKTSWLMSEKDMGRHSELFGEFSPFGAQSTHPYTLPCFCVVEEGIIKFIWTRARARRNGFARQMVIQSKATGAWDPCTEKLEFWKRIENDIPGFSFKSHCH